MSDKIKKANEYIEKNSQEVGTRFREKFHLNPPIGWMNDPNGFIYAFGKYHLFFQFHPYSAEWGPMHWGHYTSKDMLSWRQESVAIAPDMPYDEDGCFSGTSLVLGDELYIMYTSVLGESQTQALVRSVDGENFEKLGQVISSEDIPEGSSKIDFRDPKLFEREGKYYSVVGSKNNDGDGQILLFKSEDLRKWTYHGTLIKDSRPTGIYECPDYFTLGDKDVLLASPQGIETSGINYENQHSSVYMLGSMDFESGKFEKEFEAELDAGFDFYAPQTSLSKDGRRILIAWMSMWDRTNITKDLGWAGAMTLPRELRLEDGKIKQAPIRELRSYRKKHYHLNSEELTSVKPLLNLGETKEIKVDILVGSAKKVGIKVFSGKQHETLIYFDSVKEQVVFDRSKMGREIEHGEGEKDAYIRHGKTEIKDGVLTMHLIIDAASCEVFFGDGDLVMTANIYPSKGDEGTCLFVEGGKSEILRLDAYSLEINKNLEEI